MPNRGRNALKTEVLTFLESRRNFVPFGEILSAIRTSPQSLAVQLQTYERSQLVERSRAFEYRITARGRERLAWLRKQHALRLQIREKNRQWQDLLKLGG